MHIINAITPVDAVVFLVSRNRLCSRPVILAFKISLHYGTLPTPKRMYCAVHNQGIVANEHYGRVLDSTVGRFL